MELVSLKSQQRIDAVTHPDWVFYQFQAISRPAIEPARPLDLPRPHGGLGSIERKGQTRTTSLDYAGLQRGGPTRIQMNQTSL